MRGSSRPITFALAVGIALSATFAGVAYADPNPSTPGTPPAGKTPSQILATVGADAFAEQGNFLASEYNDTVPAKVLASYDSVNPLTGAQAENITTKPGCVLPRPNGANAGLTALKLNQLSDAGTGGDGTSFCLDYVRSSRPKNPTGETNLNFYALGGDAITWATIGNSYAPRTPLSQEQLKGIFECSITDWSEVGGQKGAIHVYAPGSGAATFTVFLAGIGSSFGAVTTGCGSSLHATQQNDGTTMLADPQGVAPYTVSKWAAQKNGAPGIPDRRGGSVIGLYNDTTAPTTTSVFNATTYTVVNPAFVSSPAGRLFFHTTPKPANPGDPDPLAAIFGTTGFVCTHESELLIPFGIAPLGTDTNANRYCGQVT